MISHTQEYNKRINELEETILLKELENNKLKQQIKIQEFEAYKLNEIQTLAKAGNWELNHLSYDLKFSEGMTSLFYTKEIPKTMITWNDFLDCMIDTDEVGIHNLLQNNVIKNGEDLILEHKFRNFENEIFFVRHHCKTFYNTIGHPLITVGLILDITKEHNQSIEKNEYTKRIKKSEIQLKEKQILLKNILTTIPDMLWLKDTNSNFLLCNPEFEKFFGKKEKDLLGKNDYDFFDKAIADQFRKDDLKAMTTNETLFIEEWVTYASNNKKILLETSKKTMYDDNGNVIGILGIGHDATERKLKEERLKELNTLSQSLTKSQEVLLSLFDKGESSLFRWENNGKWTIEYVSEGVNKILGYTKEDFLNQNIIYSDCIHQDDLQKVQKKRDDAIEKNLDYFKHDPYRIITKKGEEKLVMDHTSTQKDNDNNITHFIGYITDITEQIKNQEIIFHQSKISSLGEMLENIAHQWRQPLSIISTTATGAKMKKEYGLLEDEEFYKNMDNINETTQYLSQTIEDFRSFFLADTSTETKVNIEKTIKKVLSLVTDSYKSSNIEIVKNYNNSTLSISCNENLFIQALINIFNNAKDALNSMDTKDEKLVFINLENINNTIFIEIKDNANGIPKDIITKIFDPYFTTKHASQGTGIGLYMTNQIITKHLKSTIFVENVEYEYQNSKYKGASFKIKIKDTRL